MLDLWHILREKFSKEDGNPIDTKLPNRRLKSLLKKAGIDFDVRKVPSDSKGNMDEILKKAQDELNKLK